MKRVWIASVFVLVALIGVIGWMLVKPSDEPVYKGKTLTTWFRDWLDPAGDHNPEVFVALRQLGSNAVPTMLRWLTARDSALKTKVMRLLQRQKLVKVEYTPAGELNDMALIGFDALGTNGQSAMPALIRILVHDMPPAHDAMQVLWDIDPSGKQRVPYLLKWVTNADKDVRMSASVMLLQIDPEAAAKAGITNSP